MADLRASSAGAWRTVDIVVAAVIAVAFGVVFWAWNALWAATSPAFVALPAAQYLISGVWLIPAVLGGLVIRKPGAALFCELLAAIVSALIGSQWGLDTVVSGFGQGGGAELVFLLFRYQNWSLWVAALAGRRRGLGPRHGRLLPRPRPRRVGGVHSVLSRVGRGHRGDRLVLPGAVARSDWRPRILPVGTDAEPDLSRSVLDG